jgi:hypothetical protein
LVTSRKAWGEERVYFRDGAGQLYKMPVGWTSVVEPDAFQSMAAGRSRFRIDDLVRLADLIDRLKVGAGGEGVR